MYTESRSPANMRANSVDVATQILTIVTLHVEKNGSSMRKDETVHVKVTKCAEDKDGSYSFAGIRHTPETVPVVTIPSSDDDREILVKYGSGFLSHLSIDAEYASAGVEGVRVACSVKINVVNEVGLPGKIPHIFEKMLVYCATNLGRDA